MLLSGVVGTFHYSQLKGPKRKLYTIIHQLLSSFHFQPLTAFSSSFHFFFKTHKFHFGQLLHILRLREKERKKFLNSLNSFYNNFMYENFRPILGLFQIYSRPILGLLLQGYFRLFWVHLMSIFCLFQLELRSNFKSI